MNENIKVNDGGGLYDNLGIIDMLIIDCNELPKDLINGQNIRFCSRISQMAQKLAKLKEGVKNDTESLKEQIKELTGGDENV